MTENNFYKIVISTEEGSEDASILSATSANDYYSFHVRKPSWSIVKLRAYLSSLPEEWRRIVVLHQHFELEFEFEIKGIHLNEKNKLKSFKKNTVISASYHSLIDLQCETRKFDYVFLSPIFDSISKPDYHSSFDHQKLVKKVSAIPFKVIALGGISNRNISQCKEMGFAGVALLGSFWSGNS